MLGCAAGHVPDECAPGRAPGEVSGRRSGHGAELWRSGSPAEQWRVDELRAAAWRAARFGLHDTLISPVSRDLEPATAVLAQLVMLLDVSLGESGDTALVERGIAAREARGNGAHRQRTALSETGAMAGVLADLEARTLG